MLIFSLHGISACAESPSGGFAIVITGGRIIDGTGSPWYSADIGIRDGKIAAIGRLTEMPRRQTIDAHGKVVAPGFIDMLGQSELSILTVPSLPSKIYQGITTEITGEGGSVAPISEKLIKADADGYAHYHVTPDWHTLRQYFTRLEKQSLGINLATYVGATQVRRMVLGDDNKQPTSAEMAQMKALIREAMHDGAVGVSTSLMYPPAPYATTEELIGLAAEAASLGGLYATHIRNESSGVLTALDEAIRIGREAHIPVEVWHLKVAGKRNWGRMNEVVAKINSARAQGVDIAADTYAYPAWANGLSSYVPPWAHDGGDSKLIQRLKDPATRERIRKEMITPSTEWDNEWDGIPGPQSILIGQVQNPRLQPIVGKNLADVAASQGKDPIDTLFDLLIEDNAFTRGVSFGMDEPDIVLALQQPWVSIDNDYEGTSPDGPLARDYAHPRAYGTFPRILRKYVREEKKLTLEEAIRKFSAYPAQRMRLGDRGVLKTGLWADIVVFDPDTVRDRATFEQPNQLSEGMDYVLVNGVPVITNGKMTGALPGKVLRGPAWQP
jgi:dihydroorotase/N-acyl-D-amino-acid deacylase